MRLVFRMAAFKYSLLVLLSFAILATASPKVEKEKKHEHACQEFSRGVVFNESQVLGSWHLLVFQAFQQNSSESASGHCLQFEPVTVEERNNLTERVGKYIENMKWDQLSLKMKVPCEESERARVYYLERLQNEGSYRTLQMPALDAKLDVGKFHRYQMRFKRIESYLGMMDCHERFVFLLGRHADNPQLDQHLQRMINVYWDTE